ncbi:hypothetical protein VNO77_18218 [Canavalia gladiata]|uniref:Uncharacterized protein n=1 Tax=Canavalia gladiata TaxID=3824 RepID=A0AAN9LKE7_CANGL
MSGSSDEEISNADRDGYKGGGSDGDEDDDSEIGKRERRRTGSGIGKAKKVVVHQFTKAKNKLRRIRSRKALLPSPSSNAKTMGCSGKIKIIRGGRSGRGCRFCFSRPKVLESPNESPPSDPNDPNFTPAMLRTLIDKNDFYSKQCNPHLD